MRFVVHLWFVAFAFAMGFASVASAASSGGACPRPDAGSQVTAPADLYSSGGALNVTLNYRTSLDSSDRTEFCFVTPDGLESPTLHVFPGDTLNINLQNQLPLGLADAPAEMAVGPDIWNCGWSNMNYTSVNIHFHGTNTRPVCHSDEVIHTLVNSGDAYTYSVTFPKDEPPGLYWYHPHVHGLSDAAVQGGATGAIVVEGIENIQPEVADLPERILLVRDQRLSGAPPPDFVARDPGSKVAAAPSWDLTLNYVPVDYPKYTPAIIAMNPGRKEFWRVVNSSADTIVDLELSYDGVAQPLKIVALDGVPTGSHDGSGIGASILETHVLLPPAGRAEFIMTSPSAKVKKAVFRTRAIDTGPSGDSDTARPLALLSVTSPGAAAALPSIPKPTRKPGPARFDGIDAAPIDKRRKLYFSEKPLVAMDDGEQNFYITVEGAKPTLFNAANPPAIITRQGSVEEWTIENRTLEVHEFHIHQIHFQLRERDGAPVQPRERQFFDTIQVPYWSGQGPYPSITIALDFRGDIAGDFVYHCHILDHEDNGMMAIVRVLPSAPRRLEDEMSIPRASAFFLSTIAALFLLAVASSLAARMGDATIPRFADAGDSALTTRGVQVYTHECAPCHGRHLQGQPFWRLADQDAGRRAPALDQTGRAWRRSDEDLFHMVKFGRYPERPESYASHMPAFEGLLDDGDILAALAYVKARWPIGQRALQALLNPENKGMPADAETRDWRLAATCFGPKMAVGSPPAESE